MLCATPSNSTMKKGKLRSKNLHSQGFKVNVKSFCLHMTLYFHIPIMPLGSVKIYFY